jgi:Flp pilus assembly protein TadD
MDAHRFAVVLSFVFLLAPLAGLAEDKADTVAAKIVEMSRELRKKGREDAADKLLRDAAAQCEEQLRRKPDDAQARFGLAQLQVHLDQVPAAEANLARALQLEPNNAALHAFKGRMYGVEKAWRQAVVSLRRAVELDPTDAGCRMMLATCLSNIKEHQEAVTQAREAMKLMPGDKDALVFYSLMLLAAGDADEWEKVMQSAIDSRPKDIGLRDSFVHGFFLLRRPDRAYSECLELQKLDSANVEVDAKLVLYATQATRPFAAEQHVNRLKELRKAGKYADDYVLRDHFFNGNRTVLARENFEPDGEVFSKFVFYVVDELEKEECRIQFTTSDRYNEQLRKAGKLKETERVYYLMSKRGKDVQDFGAFPQPTYEQARAMAIEVLEGTRLPKPVGEQLPERQAAEPGRSNGLQQK